VEDDITREKIRIIERCLNRVREEYGGDARRLENHTIEDALVLNLTRACEAAIDLAMHVVRLKRLGLPQESRDAFTLLESALVIDAALAARMKGMVGFRNTVVHAYQEIDRKVVVKIVEQHLGEFDALARAITQHA
jgi:uncharacterized protein YutE (UPF0331/DUF86 family)